MLKLHPKDEKRVRELCTLYNGKLDQKLYDYWCASLTKSQPAKYHKFERVNCTPTKWDRPDLNQQRKNAADFLVKNFSREERYLMILERDLNGCFDAFKSERFKTPEKREQKRWDFLASFRTLIARKNEYGWSIKKMYKNGIDFIAIQAMISRLFSPIELAS